VTLINVSVKVPQGCFGEVGLEYCTVHQPPPNLPALFLQGSGPILLEKSSITGVQGGSWPAVLVTAGAVEMADVTVQGCSGAVRVAESGSVTVRGGHVTGCGAKTEALTVIGGRMALENVRFTDGGEEAVLTETILAPA